MGDAMRFDRVIDVPANIGLARAKSRRGTGEADRFEAESVEFHEKLRLVFSTSRARSRSGCRPSTDGRPSRDVVSETHLGGGRVAPVRRNGRRRCRAMSEKGDNDDSDILVAERDQRAVRP